MMRSFLFVVLISTFSSSLAETFDSASHTIERAKILSDRFHNNSRNLHRLLEDHYLAGSADEIWSPDAESALLDWFAGGEESEEVAVRCTTDMCAVDFFVPYRKYLREYNEEARVWGRANHPGYLAQLFFFPGKDGSTRLFVFRDTFDPLTL